MGPFTIHVNTRLKKDLSKQEGVHPLLVLVGVYVKRHLLAKENLQLPKFIPNGFVIDNLNIETCTTGRMGSKKSKFSVTQFVNGPLICKNLELEYKKNLK